MTFYLPFDTCNAKFHSFYHFDFATQSTKDKDDLIFAITILGGITNTQNGVLWLCRKIDYYLLEVTLPKNYNQKLPNNVPIIQKTKSESDRK